MQTRRGWLKAAALGLASGIVVAAGCDPAGDNERQFRAETKPGVTPPELENVKDYASYKESRRAAQDAENASKKKKGRGGR